MRPRRRLFDTLPLVVILPAILVTYLAYVNARQAIVDLAPTAAEAAAMRCAAEIEAHLSAQIAEVGAVATDGTLVRAVAAKDSKQVRKRLGELGRSHDFPAWAVSTAEGISLGHFPDDTKRDGGNTTDRDWFRGIKENQWEKPYVSAVYLKQSVKAQERVSGSADRPAWVVALAAPIRQGRRPVGVIFANISLVQLRNQLRPIQAKMKSAYACIVDQRGRLVYHPNFSPDDPRYSLKQNPPNDRNRVHPEMDYAAHPVVQQILRGKAVDRQPSRDNGGPGSLRRKGPYLTWARSIPHLGWGVIVHQSQAEVLGPVRRIAIQLLLAATWVILLAAALAVVISLDERRSITRDREDEQRRHEQVLAEHRREAGLHLQIETAKANARREADMRVGQEIQTRLLRKDTLGGVEIECHSLPAQEVGGDFYSIFPIDEFHQGIVVGDVSGKGVKAAMYMTVATTLLQTLGRREASPAAVLAAANMELVPTMQPMRMFVTAFYGVLDVERNVLTFSSAGHLPPMLRHSDSVEEIELIGTQPLGVTCEAEYEDSVIHLEADDALVLYSDGLVEACDEQEAMFGFDGLKAVLARTATSNPADLAQELLAAWRAVLEQRESKDDLTLVVLRCNGGHEYLSLEGTEFVRTGVQCS